MKVHLLQVLVIDHDALGVDEVERILEDANYPNRCIAPSVVKSQSAEIGDWDDDNPLNHSDNQVAEVDRLFSAWQPIETAPKDGTVILLWACKTYVLTVKFSTRMNCFIDIEAGNSQFESDFTHWMPITPPQAR
jgi:hypothetical protein